MKIGNGIKNVHIIYNEISAFFFENFNFNLLNGKHNNFSFSRKIV